MKLVVVALACSLVGCAPKVDSLRDALANGDVAGASSVVSVAKCDTPCFSELARAFGSKSDFDPMNPDQGAAAAVAVVLVRERHGEWATGVEKWRIVAQTAKGAGADAMRLAVAMRMVEIAPKLGKAIDDDREAAAIVRAIGTAIPGACATYAALPEDPTAIDKMPPPESPDHAPCVQRDLMRDGAPGAAYGFGVWRALEGAIGLWRDERRALGEGAATMTGKAKDAMTAHLATIDAATAKIATKKVTLPANDWARTHP